MNSFFKNFTVMMTFFFYLAGIWSIFGGSANAKTNTSNTQASSANELHPLSSHSVLLLLVLCFHYTKDDNPYRDALFRCKPGRKSEGGYFCILNLSLICKC